jgi:tetraacyldisaccharide-1-P 4'-kinase
VVRVLRFPDHHAYGEADVRALAAAAAEAPLVTTEKDLVKLARHPALAGIRALRVGLEVDDGEALVDRLLAPAEVASRAD